MNANFPRQKNHGSKTGLLSTVAISACNLRAVRAAVLHAFQAPNTERPAARKTAARASQTHSTWMADAIKRDATWEPHRRGLPETEVRP
jgi:hypothetical protein